MHGGVCQTCQKYFLDFMYVFFKMGILNLTQKGAISEGKNIQKRGGG